MYVGGSSAVVGHDVIMKGSNAADGGCIATAGGTLSLLAGSKIQGCTASKAGGLVEVSGERLPAACL